MLDSILAVLAILVFSSAVTCLPRLAVGNLFPVPCLQCSFSNVVVPRAGILERCVSPYISAIPLTIGYLVRQKHWQHSCC